MTQIIITADDFGMCSSVNDAIFACARSGTVTSTGVMVNMKAGHEAGAFRKELPAISVGLHWTITQGQPVLPAEQVKSLVARDGDFVSVREFWRRWNRGEVRRDE